MIDFLYSKGALSGIDKLSADIIKALKNGKKVVWLVPGGSNIPITVDALNSVRKGVDKHLLANLTIAQTDERFGPVGHKDSNWLALEDAGCKFDGVQTVPILCNLPLEETANRYEALILELFSNNDWIIAQCGVGIDGHIAGIMPNSEALSSSNLVFAYQAGQFTRVTITPQSFAHIDTAYVFVFGVTKRDIVCKIKEGTLSMNDLPAMVLKDIEHSYFYSDQL